jgi:hypothetical protein
MGSQAAAAVSKAHYKRPHRRLPAYVANSHIENQKQISRETHTHLIGKLMSIDWRKRPTGRAENFWNRKTAAASAQVSHKNGRRNKMDIRTILPYLWTLFGIPTPRKHIVPRMEVGRNLYLVNDTI